ncbi:glucosamine--fructose-6-phosphate aminotransferase (isomerizing) [Nocardiopsis algeriensis]|uniref:Glucosamine--fructose-6-phosphate aminotransferase (Isomerizing) n=2 Tax=Nocardiopsis algeriensis TaxID=1478215 RepID=A0A841IQ04_9ACTN|nr:glucosamine--fructose-6-phosphate aminotransferase (isomerizing) [Nocardiopsis algeriensis]
MTTSTMRAEIAEQPEALRRTLAELLPLRGEIEALGRSTRHVLFIARGSSDNAAVYGQYLLQVHGGRLAALGAPSVATSYGAKADLSGVLAVAVSQSGKTEEIVETMRWAADCGARTVGVTNGADSPLANESDVALVTRAGSEVAVPATKTYSTQLAALAVLALGLGGGSLDPGDLQRVPDALDEILAAPQDSLEEITERLTAVQGMVVTGRGIALTTALETALKLKEACYLHAMGMSYADLLHGPIAILDPRTPVLLAAASEGPVLQGTIALAERARSAGSPVFGIGGKELAAATDLSLQVPDLPEWVAPMGLILPAQLLTERLARRLGSDPDVPRGLNKVTQTTG